MLVRSVEGKDCLVTVPNFVLLQALANVLLSLKSPTADGDVFGRCNRLYVDDRTYR